jgi:hypothetical protein
MTGAAALIAGTALPLGASERAASNAGLQSLDAELAVRLTRFRLLRRAEFERLWHAGELQGIHAYEVAAREFADGQTGLMKTAERILDSAPRNATDEAVVARAGKACVEYCLPLRAAHLVLE